MTESFSQIFSGSRADFTNANMTSVATTPSTITARHPAPQNHTHVGIDFFGGALGASSAHVVSATAGLLSLGRSFARRADARGRRDEPFVLARPHAVQTRAHF